MRHRWFVLAVLVVTGCGQPLQISPTAVSGATQTSITPRPTNATTPSIATSVPAGAETALAAQELPTDQSQPTASPPTVVSSTPGLSISPTPAVLVIPQTAVPMSNEQRWRAQQLRRQTIEPPRTYLAQGAVPLLWFDPMTGQMLEIGSLIGSFNVQATFSLRGSNLAALEVPYRINVDYGLTAISDALRERMKSAGYTESVEAYVVQTESVIPK